MSYNGSGTFNINTSGQPVVTGTVISSTAFNALTADLATGLSTAITKDGQTAATARIPFAQGISSTLVTDSTSTTTGSIITAGGVGVAKALYVGTTANFGGVATYSAQPIFSSLTASSAVATDASKGLVSVTNTGTGNNVLATSPTLVTPVLGAASATSVTVAAGAVGTPSITTSGDTNTGIFFPAADTIAFAEGGAEIARFDSSGNLALGTTSASARLHVEGANAVMASTGLVTVQATTDGADIGGQITFQNSTARRAAIAGRQEGASATAGYLQFGTRGSSGDITEQARIDSSGSLSINTTTASSKLNVNAEMSLLTDGNNRGIIGWDNTNKLISFGTINASTSYFNAMSLRDGNLLVGRTSQSGVEKLGVVGNAGGSIIMSLQRPTESVSFIGCDNAQSFRVYDSGSVQRFGVTVAGSCQNTTGSYGTLSDQKLKENIVDATPKLDALMQVKVRNYGLKAEPNSKFIGFIAQELREIFPSMVEENPDEDESGEKTGEVTLAVKTTVFIPMLVKAIQEQQALITALTTRITVLEAA